MSGALTPKFPAGGQTVTITVYRYVRGQWAYVKQLPAMNADNGDVSRYALKLKLNTTGKYRFQASSAATAAWADSTSPVSKPLTVAKG